MNKVLKAILIVVIVVIVAVGGYLGIKKLTGNKKAASNTTYIVETASRSNIDESVSATGTVFASVTKDVAANNSGNISGLSVKVGDTVKKGETLFQVYSQQLQQQLESAKIDLQRQEITLSNLENSASQATQSSSKGQPTQQSAQQNQTADIQSQIELQKLQVESSQNSLDNIQQQYDQMTVTSPIDGVVTAVNNANGDSIQPGKAVLTITDPTSLKIDTQVDELDISKVKVGQAAQVSLNAITGKTYEGTVESISSIGSTTNNVTTYDVVIDLKDISGIMLGMTANADIEIASKSDALVIPAEALITRGSRNFVMVQSDNSQQSGSDSSTQGQGYGSSNGGSYSSGGQNGYGMRRNGFGTSSMPGSLVPVQIGLENENYVEITSGITEGQKIMVALPQVSSTSTTSSRSSMRGLGGIGGGFGGGMYGGGSGGSRNSSSKN